MTSPGNFSYKLTGLKANTTYYFLAQAIANNRTVYGIELKFTTRSEPLIGTGALTPHGSSMAGTTTTTQPVLLSNLVAQNARLSARAVTPDMPVTVTADITNKGTTNGTRTITLYVNGEVESTQGVTVNSGNSSQLTFSVSRSEPGDYSVYVDGVPAGSFKVELVKESDIVLMFSITLLAIAFMLGLFMLRRRQRAC